MKDINCIFCQYKNDPEGCQQILADSQAGKYWNCPTISNVYYGKLIYRFPFNIIFKIQRMIWDYRAAKEFIERRGN